MSKVIVFGSLNMDLSIEAPRMPQLGETINGGNFITNPGGKGANQAVAAAKMGGEVWMLGAVGGDAFGQQMRESLEASGVQCGHLACIEGTPTGIAVITRVGGDNCIVLNADANHALSASYVAADLDELAQPGDVFLTQLECDFDATMAAIADAHARGMFTVLNPAPARAVPAEMLACLDMLVVNESECELICGIYPVDEATCRAALEELAAAGVGCPVVTLGARGSMLRTPAGEVLATVPPAVAAVDTTCAGDTYIGALCAAQAAGTPLPQAMELACRASALTCTRVGAQQAIPTLAEAEAL